MASGFAFTLNGHGVRVDASASCVTALAGLHAGSPRIAATEALGAPSSGGARCSVWRWPPATGAIDGARICFADGRATLVQTAQHG